MLNRRWNPPPKKKKPLPKPVPGLPQPSKSYELQHVLWLTYMNLWPVAYMACKFQKASAIVSDSWVVNLQNRENKMDFSEVTKHLNEIISQYSEKRQGPDLSSELTDLLTVYTNSCKHLKQRKESQLSNLINSMRSFIETHEECHKVEQKLQNLVEKLPKPDCSGENCSQEEESEEESE